MRMSAFYSGVRVLAIYIFRSSLKLQAMIEGVGIALSKLTSPPPPGVPMPAMAMGGPGGPGGPMPPPGALAQQSIHAKCMARDTIYACMCLFFEAAMQC